MEEKIETEKGITLIALIITIIILIILAAVTIKSLTHDGLVDMAIKGAENYDKAQTDEMNMLNDIDVLIKDTINNIEDGSEPDKPKTNNLPIFTEDAYAFERTASGIKISALATDADNEPLTYTLNWGTTEACENDEILTKNAGELAEFELTDGINKTATYFWKIKVQDKEEPVDGKTGKTEYCSGYNQQTRTCTVCNGEMETCTDCNGKGRTDM